MSHHDSTTAPMDSKVQITVPEGPKLTSTNFQTWQFEMFLQQNLQEKSEHKETLMVLKNTMKVEAFDWYIDSGATSHISFQRHLFTEYKSITPISIQLADNSIVYAEGMGVVEIKIDERIIRLTRVLYVPKFQKNLISLSNTLDKGIIAEVCKSGFIFKSKTNQVIATARKVGNLYALNGTAITQNHECNLVSQKISESLPLWHRRLGHVNSQTLISMNKM